MGQPAAILNTSLYDEDFFLWTQEQAKLSQERRFDELDLANFIDEVTSVGGSDRRDVRNRLAVLLAHSLKWRTPPGASSTGRIDFTLFPATPPFTIEQALDDGFLPKEPDLYDQS